MTTQRPTPDEITAADIPDVAAGATGTETPPISEEDLPHGFRIRDDLPSVVTNGVNLRDLVDGTLLLLNRHNDPPRIFKGAEGPTRLATDPSGTLITEAMDAAAIGLEVAQVLDTMTVTAEGALRKRYPPTELIAGIRSHPSPGFPPLLGISRAPMMLADGSIISTNGYSPEARSYIDLPDELRFPDVAAEPTDGDVRAALALLTDELFGDFLWNDNGASLANMLGFLLTPVLRSLFEGPSPLFAVVANQQGTGKSLATQAVAIVATGDEVATSPHPTNTEEMRKLATSTLRRSPPLVTLDNVGSMVKSPELARLTTSSRWGDRILGRSVAVDLPNRTAWCLNGNAIRFGGDMQRRVVPIELYADRHDPWSREGFRHPNLKTWARENRGELLAAIFTLARSWIQADRPTPTRQHGGGFESWSITIGGILENAGITDHLSNLDRAMDADLEHDDWSGFLGLMIQQNETAFTAGRLLELCEQDPRFRDVVDPLVTHALTAKAIGESLMTRDGRWHDLGDGISASVNRGDKNRNGVRNWEIRLNEAGS